MTSAMVPFALLLTSLLPLQQDSPGPQWGRRIEWSKDGAPSAREHAALIADPAHSPGGRYGFAFALDAKHGRLLICGGEIPPPEGVIDRAGGRALLGFGNTAQGRYDDLVEIKLR